MAPFFDRGDGPPRGGLGQLRRHCKMKVLRCAASAGRGVRRAARCSAARASAWSGGDVVTARSGASELHVSKHLGK